MAKLHWTSNEGEQRTWELGAPETWVGRRGAGRVDIDVPDVSVSRSHFRIERRVDGFWLVDAGANANGTLVNGRRVDEVRLHDRDSVTAGRSRFVFLAAEPVRDAETTILPSQVNLRNAPVTPEAHHSVDGSSVFRRTLTASALVFGLLLVLVVVAVARHRGSGDASQIPDDWAEDAWARVEAGCATPLACVGQGERSLATARARLERWTVAPQHLFVAVVEATRARSAFTRAGSDAPTGRLAEAEALRVRGMAKLNERVTDLIREHKQNLKLRRWVEAIKRAELMRRMFPDKDSLGYKYGQFLEQWTARCRAARGRSHGC